jgi:malic enzyme
VTTSNWTFNTLTIKHNSVAVLGLGNIGPDAATPVMEGKAMLFKELAEIDAYPAGRPRSCARRIRFSSIRYATASCL